MSTTAKRAAHRRDADWYPGRAESGPARGRSRRFHAPRITSGGGARSIASSWIRAARGSATLAARGRRGRRDSMGKNSVALEGCDHGCADAAPRHRRSGVRDRSRGRLPPVLRAARAPHAGRPRSSSASRSATSSPARSRRRRCTPSSGCAATASSGSSSARSRCAGGERRYEARVSRAGNGNALVVVRDVHDRVLVEQELQESEARFRLMADHAPVMLWMAGVDAACGFFNQGWLEFAGRPLEKELGVGWAEGIHPEDFQRCMHVYLSAFVVHESFRMEYRLRRADGEYRWMLDTGVPRYAPDGTLRRLHRLVHRHHRDPGRARAARARTARRWRRGSSSGPRSWHGGWRSETCWCARSTIG